MRIIECDICNKDAEGNYVSAGTGFFPQIEVCYTCGTPIVEFLKKHKIIKEENKKHAR